jgi:hypothetical protein
MVGYLVNGELERVWKEAVVASFKVNSILSLHLDGGIKENHENVNLDNLLLDI